jgi:putative GTP pyrophosphokinase
MNYQSKHLDRLCREISIELEDEFSRIGIFFRVFSRVKSIDSIENKIKLKGDTYYDGVKKRIRDVIGVRVVLYFPDDVAIVSARLKSFCVIEEETIDKSNETNFEPVRLNLVCKLKPKQSEEFRAIVKNSIIDSTYEVQLRTILSEGWHEVDHDLRYKCPNDWNDNKDLSRSLNGILATLETSEYTMIRLFDQLCYRHYRANEVEAMMRTKFRLRLADYKISEEVRTALNPDLVKELYKLEREDVVNYLFDSGIIVPITLENLIFIINLKFVKDSVLLKLTPSVLLQEMHQV